MLIAIACCLLLGDASLFAPTPIDAATEALQLARVSDTSLVYDLGCGDGRVVIVAAKVFGCRAVGVDIDMQCVQLAKANVTANHVESLVTIRQQDATKTDISKADLVFVYLMPDLTTKIDFKSMKRGSKIVAHDKPIPGLKPAKTRTIKSMDGREHSLYLYIN